MEDNKFWSVVKWTVYAVLMTIIVFGYLLPVFLAIVIKIDNEFLYSWLNCSGVLFAVFSAGLGIYSVVRSSKGSNALKKSISDLRELTQGINQRLDKLETNMNALIRMYDAGIVSDWKHDGTGPKS